MNHIDGEQLQKLFQLILDRLTVDSTPLINGDKKFVEPPSYSALRAQAHYVALNILGNSDFTEVVWCKNCVYWYKFEYPDDGTGICDRLRTVHNSEHPITLGTHFCGYGRRNKGCAKD